MIVKSMTCIQTVLNIVRGFLSSLIRVGTRDFIFQSSLQRMRLFHMIKILILMSYILIARFMWKLVWITGRWGPPPRCIFQFHVITMPTWLLSEIISALSGYLQLYELYWDWWRHASVTEIYVLSKALLMLYIIEIIEFAVAAFLI
jgi:hypothetical protein